MQDARRRFCLCQMAIRAHMRMSLVYKCLTCGCQLKWRQPRHSTEEPRVLPARSCAKLTEWMGQMSSPSKLARIHVRHVDCASGEAVVDAEKHRQNLVTSGSGRDAAGCEPRGQKGERLASHPRSAARGRHTATDAHLAPAHRRVAGWNSQRFLGWAVRIERSQGSYRNVEASLQ